MGLAHNFKHVESNPLRGELLNSLTEQIEQAPLPPDSIIFI
jgi:hypothetical protein